MGFDCSSLPISLHFVLLHNIMWLSMFLDALQNCRLTETKEKLKDPSKIELKYAEARDIKIQKVPFFFAG